MANQTETKHNQKYQKAGRGGARPGAGRKRGAIGARPAPKGALDDLTAIARSHFALAIATLLEIATNGEKEPARVMAANSLLDRGYGKPRQAVEVSGQDGLPVQVLVRIVREGRRVTAG